MHTKDPDVRILISRIRRTSTVVLVQQLAGRTVLIVHGDRDQLLPQRSSPAYAERARERGATITRCVVERSGHTMLRHPAEWTRHVHEFVVGCAQSRSPA